MHKNPEHGRAEALAAISRDGWLLLLLQNL